ncbi:N-acetylglucosamine kinase [Nonomuraea sp. NPDC050556]|uniref:N-acetylglucosamine kinase n=1 Tax=Nonomuraea sp. NPDC050556 TaxID=3364369 RepID=UPI00379BA563
MQNVLGIDAGATSTRVAIHALDGTRVGYGKAGGGNPSAHGLEKASAAVAQALRDALAGVDPGTIAASVAGVAGKADALAPMFADLWTAHGIPGQIDITGDLPIAFVAGTAEPDGTVLLSGTGADAARIEGREQRRIADGLGWLLGDEGSGFWIGRAAAKAVVHTLDRGEDHGLLVELVVTHFLGSYRPDDARAQVDRVVRLAQADHMRLAKLSVLVSEAAEKDDPMALAIVARAARLLADTLGRVHQGGPVVVAGSVLTNEGPVRRAVRDLIGPFATAQDGAGAAAWLAALSLGAGTGSHATFTRAAGSS